MDDNQSIYKQQIPFNTVENLNAVAHAFKVLRDAGITKIEVAVNGAVICDTKEGKYAYSNSEVTDAIESLEDSKVEEMKLEEKHLDNIKSKTYFIIQSHYDESSYVEYITEDYNEALFTKKTLEDHSSDWNTAFSIKVQKDGCIMPCGADFDIESKPIKPTKKNSNALAALKAKMEQED